MVDPEPANGSETESEPEDAGILNKPQDWSDHVCVCVYDCSLQVCVIRWHLSSVDVKLFSTIQPV